MSGLGLLWLALSCAARPVIDIPSVPVDMTPQPDPVREDRAELLYFVMVDRFANGDPGNDDASPGPAVDPSDPQAWHGGDLRGVMDHLDHIDSMGVTQLWLSPVFTTRTAPIGEWGAFHGYWQWDPTTVEPRFGTSAELLELRHALQARDMGLVLDLVTNHVGYDAPLLTEHPDWFHDNGSIEDWQDRQQLETWQVHGLPDLDQDNPEVARWLTQAAWSWRNQLGPTGFRVDAVRHVPNSFLATLGDTLADPDDGLWWLGEDFTGDVAELAESQRSGHFSHVFDFPLHYAMTDVFCDDASPARLASVLWQDRLYERPQGLVTFLDNHDLPRVLSRCHDDPYRVLRALTFLYATRGVPSLTWGTESLLAGAEEPLNRRDMDFFPAPLTQVIGHLMDMRSASPAMWKGTQRVIHLDDDSMAIARVFGDQAVIVGVNNGDSEIALQRPAPLDGGVLMGLINQEGQSVVHSVSGAGGLDGDSVAGHAPQGRPGWVLPPHGVRVWQLQGDFEGFQPHGAPVAVQVEVHGAPAGQVRMVGTDPALGHWDPTAGVAMTCDETACRGTVTVPEGAVLEGKPVVVGDEVQWSQGPNRAVLVKPGATWVVGW